MTIPMEQVEGLEQLVPACVEDVLETMFFTAARCVGGFEEVPDPAQAESLITAMEFRGRPSGRFWLWLASDTASALAASFLGLDPGEVGSREREQVSAELANMICGAVVSRFESEAAIELSAPAAGACDGEFEPPPSATLVQRYLLDEGRMALAFQVGEVEG